jgi:hypothetical protein
MPFFLDDGTEVNPDELEIPDKCLKCKKFNPNYHPDNDSDIPNIEWDEYVLCTLTRMGSMDEKDFQCNKYIFNPGWKSKIN